MIPVARMGDIAMGVCIGHRNPISTIGYIIPTSTNVMVNSLPVARMGDYVMTLCGHFGMIVGGSNTVLAKSIPIARIGDYVAGIFTGIIMQGSSTVMSK